MTERGTGGGKIALHYDGTCCAREYDMTRDSYQDIIREHLERDGYETEEVDDILNSERKFIDRCWDDPAVTPRDCARKIERKHFVMPVRR